MNYSKSKLSKISNIIFLNISIFIIFFLWCNFYIRNFRLSIISSFLAIIAFAIIFFPIYLHKTKISKNSKINRQKFLDFVNNILIMNNAEICTFLSTHLNFEEYTKISNTHITTKNKDIFFIFSDEKIFECDFLRNFKNRISDNIQIYCFKKLNIDNIYKNVNIEFIEIDKLYKTLLKSNTEIPNKYKFEKTKISFTEIFKGIFNKSKSRGYFMYGLLILFTSMFTPYNIYYIIFSTLLFLLSIFSRFNHLYN